MPPRVFASFLAMSDGARGYPGPPIDLNSSEFRKWIESQKCTDTLERALEMATQKMLEYYEKKSDLEKALKDRKKEEQVIQEEESLESPKNGVGENIRSIIQQIEQGEIDGIQLSDKKVTLGEAKAMAKAMANAKKRTIKKLDLFGNEFGDEGVISFSKVIANENSAVEHLDLGWCGMTDLGARALAEALKKNKRVTYVRIGNNKVTARGIGAIAEALETNSCITRLLVNACRLDCDGASRLAQALKTNSVLKRIHLGSNKEMGKGAAEIAAALKENRSLEHIDLSYCDIDDDTVNKIALALQENKKTALKEIDLSGNKITDAGAERLVQALSESNTIEQINLTSCSVSSCSDDRVRF